MLHGAGLAPAPVLLIHRTFTVVVAETVEVAFVVQTAVNVVVSESAGAITEPLGSPDSTSGVSVASVMLHVRVKTLAHESFVC